MSALIMVLLIRISVVQRPLPSGVEAILIIVILVLLVTFIMEKLRILK